MTKSGRRIGFIGILLILTMVLAACSVSQPVSTPKPADAPKTAAETPKAPTGRVPDFISIGTAPAGASFYPLGIAMAEAIKENVGINSSAQTTGASIENINLLVSGQAEVGFVMADTAMQAIEGTDNFEGKPVEILRVLLAGHTLPYILVAREDSGIKTFADIKGKRIAASMPRAAGNRLTMLAALEANGMTWDDVKFVDINSLQESVGQVKDGSLDGVWYPVAGGNAVYIDLTTAIKTNWVSLDDKTIEFVMKRYPALRRTTVPTSANQGQNQVVESFGAVATIFTSSEIDEDVAYKITKAVLENQDKLIKAHSAGKAYSLENGPVYEGVFPYHPGAIRYYKEKGVWKGN